MNTTDQLASIGWDEVDQEKRARRSRRAISNKDFVKEKHVDMLFEAVTMGMMVFTPEDPVLFMLECLLKVEMEGIKECVIDHLSALC